MPIYDYRCQGCGEISEIFLRGEDNTESIVCPVCGSKRVERLFSASYLMQTEMKAPGKTCCGKSERCETPPCSKGDVCSRSYKVNIFESQPDWRTQ
jgi:putative FmdB family regulatory protein